MPDAVMPALPHVAFAWHGLPFYAARQIAAVQGCGKYRISVVGTPPPFCKDDIDDILDHHVVWQSVDSTATWESLIGRTPDLAVVTGWAFPFCNGLARDAKQHGAAVVRMVDNRWRGDLRQHLGSLAYRLIHNRRSDAVWVPGYSSERLMQSFGVPSQRIYRGLYGCDAALFSSDTPLAERPRRIGFVGQMNMRKGVDLLVDAFVASRLTGDGWQLHMYGDGPLSNRCAGVAGVVCHPATPPQVLVSELAQCRIAVLPSRDDNWGVALHEGAAMGCILIASAAVGAHMDLISSTNGLVVQPGKIDALIDALHQVTRWPEASMVAARAESVLAAARFGPQSFAAVFDRIVSDLL